VASARQVTTSIPPRHLPDLLPLDASLDHPMIVAYIHYANTLLDTTRLWRLEMCQRAMLANVQDMLARSAQLGENGDIIESDHPEDVVVLDPSKL